MFLMNSLASCGQEWFMSAHGEPAATVAGWFDLHVDAVHAYAARRVGPELARDVVADTFRIALEQYDRYDASAGTERMWLFGIATNLLHRHWRTEERRLRASRAAGGRAAAPFDPLVQVEERVDASRDVDALVDALDALDPGDRDVLVLTVWQELNSVEVGAVLGIPAGTVRSRLNRIRRQLHAARAADERQLLEPEHG